MYIIETTVVTLLAMRLLVSPCWMLEDQPEDCASSPGRIPGRYFFGD
jgi:hypothetical protein